MIDTRKVDGTYTSQQVIWSSRSDRHIFIRFSPCGEINGMTFMQGEDYSFDEIQYEAKILEFYRCTITHMRMWDKRLDVETIDNILWLYHTVTCMEEDVEGYMSIDDFKRYGK